MPATDATVPKNLELASFRYEVSQILRDSAREFADVAVIKQRAEATLTRLRSLSYASEQLVQMMIDDLESLLISYDQYDRMMPPEITTNLVQHSAYLAMGRGLRSQIPTHLPLEVPPPMPFPNDGAAPGTGAVLRSRTAHIDNTSSPFSNQTQTRITTVLRTASSQV
jgi:hypothetical protein